ncbi:MAG: hypothetical protein JXK05_06840 [Campylobacterales bacterium]|nr:hypothetical protein [Campylobacterales bacterium]
MNEHNAISKTTKLYGFIAEKAQSNRFSVTLNRLFKAGGHDAMMIPMNIRHDDLYYTISNMRHSHLCGVMIGAEYQEEVLSMLDNASPEVTRSGFCDALMIRDGRLEGFWVLPEVLLSEARGLHVRRIALLGSNALAAALALRLGEFELSMFDPEVESLLELGRKIDLEVDINRITPQSDLSGFDLVIDATPQRDLYRMVAQGGRQSIEAYGLLEPYCETMYHILLKEWVK